MIFSPTDGIDVAFRLGDLHTDNVIAKKIIEVGSALVATPEFIAQFDKPETLPDLAHFRYATWGNSCSVGSLNIFTAPIPPLTMSFTSNDLQVVLHYVLQGLAIGILPPYAVQEALQAGELVEIFTNQPKKRHNVHLIYPSHKHPSAVLKAFVEFCLKH
ncbi:LysR substrate-binding domain-containing protein [Rodentibacter haemolyticus]|uniref:LysR substrate-binding domain-containing protein n=1 Tax=Rodentibacter haemolyticus TaxID=2778911 RepID=A0ABX6UXI8_9PAST|nr:LysR substrate-binding domain-containing protein [Rodentibacter haemolyticus]QPB41921.1 hypothetical protein IHV77_08315 [Rodentibacter haemolyticus]